MTDTSPGAVVAYLVEIRKRWDVWGEAESLPRLLDGYDTLLKLADDWDAKGAEIVGQVGLQDCDGALAAFKVLVGQRYQDCAQELREAIARELLGEEASRD